MDVIDAATSVLPILRADAAMVDSAAQFPEAGLRALRESGLFGLLVPAELGGLGRGLLDLVDTASVLATGCLSTAMIWAMHCQQTDALARFAGPSLRELLLPRIAAGEVYMASVTTEPSTGGHLLSAGAALRARESELVLDRVAPVVTGGEYADGFLVTMREDEDAAANRVSLVYADRDQLRLDVTTPWEALGMRGTRSVGMSLSGKVPRNHLVGEPGEFRRIAVESMIPAGHLSWAACWLGTARGALAEVVGIARSARRPRSLDARSDLVTERLGRIRMDLELGHAYLRRVAGEVDALRTAGATLDNPAVQVHLNTVKVSAAEISFRVVDRLMQLAGLATGYLQSSAVPLERHFRDLRSASLNYADERLLTATGALTLMDRAVTLA